MQNPQKQMFDRSINQRAVIIFKSYIPLIPWVQKPIDVHTSVHTRGSVNYGKVPVFVNKVYWNTAMLVHFHIIYGCFCAATAELSNIQTIWAAKLKIFIICPFTEKKFAELWSI